MNQNYLIIIIVSVIISLSSLFVVYDNLSLEDDQPNIQESNLAEIRKMTQLNVEKILELRQNDEDNLIGSSNGVSNFIDDSYPESFILEIGKYQYLQHTDVNRKGEISVGILAADEPLDEVLKILESGKGTWIHYTELSHDQRMLEQKQAWIKAHRGDIIGSAYVENRYPSEI